MLQIIRLKPNPAGKDRFRFSSPSASQLAGEWVDVKNISGQPVNMAGLTLYHLAHPAGGGKPEWQLVTTFAACHLPPGQVVRIHSGAGHNTSVIRPEDLAGADYHAFTGSDRYVWNNAEGDCAGLWSTSASQWIDVAFYDEFPPEGEILYRLGEKLIPAGARV